MDEIEQDIGRLLINWFHVKDDIPRFNAANDPLFHNKFALLVNAVELLDGRPYQEWSDEVDFRLTNDLSTARERELSGNAGQTDSLNHLISLIIYSDIEITVETMVSHVCMVDRFLESLLYFLSDLPSNQILRVMKEVTIVGEESLDPLSFDDRQDQLILHAFEAVKKELVTALKAITLGEFRPLLNLCELTLYTLTIGKLGAVKSSMKSSKGSQQRKAANARHQKSRQTKAFAISLFDKNPDKNPHATAIAIREKVKAYGATVGFYFSSDLAAHNRIYAWLREHKNNK